MNDEVVHLDGKMPQVEADMPDIDPAARGVFQDRLDLPSNAALKVLGARVPVQAEDHDEHQHGQRDEDPPEQAGDTVVRATASLRSRGFGARCAGLWRLGVSHGASSPGCRTVMLPWARRLCSQSRKRLDTCCCCNTSRIRGSTDLNGAGLVPAFLYCGSIVFW